MTIAPSKFGKFAGALLVGNFGDGRVHAYDPDTGKFLGTLRTSGDKVLVIDGLWSLSPGPDKESVIFSSGPDGEEARAVGADSPLGIPCRHFAPRSKLRPGRVRETTGHARVEAASGARLSAWRFGPHSDRCRLIS
jgi:hypothetical protein